MVVVTLNFCTHKNQNTALDDDDGGMSSHPPMAKIMSVSAGTAPSTPVPRVAAASGHHVSHHTPSYQSSYLVLISHRPSPHHVSHPCHRENGDYHHF